MTAYQRLPAAPFAPVPSRDRIGEGAAPLAFYDLAWLDPRGFATWDRRRLPALPEIDCAVGSFARGAMFAGISGPIAIEDLLPGDEVASVDGGKARITWIGSRAYGHGAERPLFYRVAAHAFSGQGPTGDVVLGAHAHVLVDTPRCRPLVGGTRAFAPIAAFEDGDSVAPLVPPGEVAIYGVACTGQAGLLVSGLPVESYHPARATGRSLTRAVMSEMGNLFPQVNDGAGFGAPRIPYLSMSEAQGLELVG
jgi:hypothetical protein